MTHTSTCKNRDDMPNEIERKYLVNGDAWRAQIVETLSIRQGYLISDTVRTVRVRATGERGYLTIKAKPTPGTGAITAITSSSEYSLGTPITAASRTSG